MKLYGTPPTRALRPIWMLNELGLECEIVLIDMPTGEHKGAAFRAINPFGKVPYLVDGDVRMAESAAMMLYLAERYGNGRFIPAEPAERAEMQQWIFYFVTEVEQPLWRASLHGFLYPEEERNPAEIALADRDGRLALAPLDAHLARREWLVGSTPGVADFLAAYTLDWAGERGLLQETPALIGYLERLYARPSAPPRIGEAMADFQAGRVPGRYRNQPT